MQLRKTAKLCKIAALAAHYQQKIMQLEYETGAATGRELGRKLDLLKTYQRWQNRAYNLYIFIKKQ